METTINNQSLQLDHAVTQKNGINLWNKVLAIADAQAANQTGWFLFSLVFGGVCFLPIPAVLLYYYNASIIVLPITFGLFLGSIIVGMGGSGIRFMLGYSIVSLLINLMMLAYYIL
jgi:hypothetical protein